ncbi:tetratricopeptide repeat protein [Teredinibacter haidensis]|uniref:tetratricopeptide repeat protein n=1 Tax=Teredinibacter haidensis TaxID=2731755 RepID=UPI0009491C87|nr:tetratricopeptide repeat protein [Teredinibacter haidensis]
MNNNILTRVIGFLKCLGFLSLLLSVFSCSSHSFFRLAGEESPELELELKRDDTETSKYGFQKEDQTVEEHTLIKRFELDKSNLDHAITNTKDLISKSYDRPFLPELYIRLAELYTEKSRVVFFLRRLEMGERGKTREISSLEATGLKEKAIETYLQIASHYPEFEELDKVHFYLAHEFRELGKYSEMVDQYESILKEFPFSEFVPESLLLLGDHAYEEKNIDQALGYYLNVLQYPKSSAVVIARYKLAWVHINKRNYSQALDLFEQSVKNRISPSTVDVDTYNRVDIRLEALADMAYTYSQVYKETKPGDDSKYFKDIAWSRRSYIMVMEKLSKRYMIKHKWDNAAYIYRELSEIQFDGDKLLQYTENLYTCVLESKNFNNSDKDVALIVKALEQNVYSVHVDEKHKLLTDYEVYARDVATRLHEKAKRTRSLDDYLLAASVYEEFLNFFDASPKYSEMKINYAESLFAGGDFTRAGKVYESIALHTDDIKSKHDPLYSAAVAYYTALDDKENLNYYEIAFSQDGLRDVGQAYASLYPESSKVQDILFNIARIQYDKGEFDDAIQEFSSFVKRYPNGDNANAAVELIMDALNLTENYGGLVDLQQELAGIPKLDSSVKQKLVKIGKSAQAKIIQEMVVESINDWDSGKDKLLSFVDNSKTAGMGIQALNALFVSSEEHGDIETMHIAGQNIISRFPRTENAENALKALIDLSLTTAQYRVLADYLEQYVQQFPKSENASDFLFQAGQIRGNLKQTSLAINIYRKLLDGYRLDKEYREKVVLALITEHNANGEKESAYRVMDRYKSSINSKTLNAVGAELSYYTNRTGSTQSYMRKARRNISQGEISNDYFEPLGRTAYGLANRSYDRFMKLKLGTEIDNSVVTEKTKLQEQLQSEYISAINFKSPRWSILSCYRLYEINSEYALFLETAPDPEGFSAEEITQYKQIIYEKSLEYKNEAVQYLNTGQELAKRIRPFDRQIALYNPDVGSTDVRNKTFLTRSKQKQIGLESLKENRIRAVYDSLYRNPDDVDALLSLANIYKQRGDFGQAIVVAKKLLAEQLKLGRHRRAEVYALMGVVYIHFGEDVLASEALQKSLDIDSANYSAAVNLAGLYYHYGYEGYANSVYSKRVGLKSKGDEALILARAEGFFNAPD